MCRIGCRGRIRKMAKQLLVPPQEQSGRAVSRAVKAPSFLTPQVEKSTLQSLFENLRDVLFPEKLPPLKLTSRPIPVRSPWGTYNNTKTATALSILVHVFFIGGIIAMSLVGVKVVQEAKKDSVTLVAPDVSVYMPVTPKAMPAMGGGGGGGERSKIQAPKGKLPKISNQQITPPEVIVRND